MTRLYKQLRIHQIFGANTGVGKTVFSAALSRASILANKNVYYLKPVSTGAPDEADDLHMMRYCNHSAFESHCIFRYTEPLSPHLAVQKDAKVFLTSLDYLVLILKEIISDEKLAKAVDNFITKRAGGTTRPSVMYIETAGGVNSPAISGNSQADVYRQLLLPIVLIGDSRLGGISSTISAYESLLLRGYQIDAISMFSDEYYQNHLYLQNYFAEQEIPLFYIPPPPTLLGNIESDRKATDSYYSPIDKCKSTVGIPSLETWLDKVHEKRFKKLDSMAERTLQHVWWPFVQHGMVKDKTEVTVIDSARGDFFSVYDGSKDGHESLLDSKFDGSASWWTQTLGHGNRALTMAAAQAAGRYGHVMFPQATHLPALQLAETLVQGPGKGWASRVFFSDNGSTGMEVALKMAFRAFAKRNGWKKNVGPELGVLGLKGSYHGDTIGAMNACQEGVYTCEWHNAKGYWLDAPTVGVQQGNVNVTLSPSLHSTSGISSIKFESISAAYDVNSRLDSPLAGVYREFIQNTLQQLYKRHTPKLAALVLEPLVMGAGGMIFVDPLFQRILIDCVRSEEHGECVENRWKGLPVIFDEVFVGLYRLGFETCSTNLGVFPDISVYAKMLTGGTVPMAVTLTNDSIYQAFMGDTKTEALLHGHSYTAHAIGCQVAIESLRQMRIISKTEPYTTAQQQWTESQEGSVVHSNSPWSFWSPEFVRKLSLKPSVDEVMTLGYHSGSAQSALGFLKNITIENDDTAPFGVHYRTLGNVAYFMCSLNSRPETLRSLETVLLQQAHYWMRSIHSVSDASIALLSIFKGGEIVSE
ncbi:hypothetical protein Clacol_001327 [Clathrus columnatus]|uniref:Adenosylmethionine-8-amino-7-oxononanoate aminotransferase n=1 Tax=Clathrus columnatus TaxID=1419009 RepID=A0AAV4ZY23_9AGAM|nr:hypothetical protein Clacol_001327 [Clathrus columnatus]